MRELAVYSHVLPGIQAAPADYGLADLRAPRTRRREPLLKSLTGLAMRGYSTLVEGTHSFRNHVSSSTRWGSARGRWHLPQTDTKV